MIDILNLLAVWYYLKYEVVEFGMWFSIPDLLNLIKSSQPIILELVKVVVSSLYSVITNRVTIMD